MLLTLILSAVLVKVSLAHPTTVSVEPQAIQDPSMVPGTQFTIDLCVDYVDKLWAYQFTMSWDPDVLHGVSFENGPFLESNGGNALVVPPPDGGEFNNTLGTLSLGGAALYPVTKFPTGGSDEYGPLGSVTFEVVGVGSTPMTLGPETGLANRTGGWIVHKEENPEFFSDGYFKNSVEEYELEIHSTPITGIEFTLNGSLKTTPFPGVLQAANYVIEMPSSWTDGETPYNFLQWEDDSTNRTRVIDLTQNMSLTATYIEAAEYMLTINSTPVTGVNFTIDDDPYQTLFSETLTARSYTIKMPTECTIDETPYIFLHWEDKSTNATRTIQLTTDMSLTATYKKRATYTLIIRSTPVTGVKFTLDNQSYTTSLSKTLLEGTHTIKMPTEWKVGEDTYEFYAWTDLVMQPQRTITLTSNKSVTAMYILGMKRYTLKINTTAVGSTLIEGMNFTLDGSLKTTLENSTYSFSKSLEAKKHVIQMPPECEVEGTRYWFVDWNDTGSAIPSRVVDLTKNMSLTAFFTNRSVHNIDQDTYYETIQWAIGNATEDDTIEVYPKTYYEYLTIDKPLKLLGKDPSTTIIDGSLGDPEGAWALVYVTADNITFSGFTLKNSTYFGYPATGIYVGDAVTYVNVIKGCIISGNIISDCSDDIGLSLCDNITVCNNVLTTADYSMWLWDAHNNTIYGNTITSGICEGALTLWDSNNNTIYENTFSNSDVAGLCLLNSYDNMIYHNNFFDNARTITTRNAASFEENNGWASPQNTY